MHSHSRGGGGWGESLWKRQATLLRVTDCHWDATQGDFEIAKIRRAPRGNTHTHTHIQGGEKWRFSAVFTTFGIWWVHLKEGDWVRVCMCPSVSLCAWLFIVIYVCALAQVFSLVCTPFFILTNPWYLKFLCVRVRKYIFLFSVCRSLTVCDILGGDWAPLFTRLPQLLCLEVDLCT